MILIKIIITYYLLSGLLNMVYNVKYSQGAAFLVGFIEFPFFILRRIKELFKSKRLKLDNDQYILIEQISKELNISKGEVLFMLIEFGQMLMITSQAQDENGNKSPLEETIEKKFGNLPEYRNWNKIAAVVYESFKAGEK